MKRDKSASLGVEYQELCLGTPHRPR